MQYLLYVEVWLDKALRHFSFDVVVALLYLDSVCYLVANLEDFVRGGASVRHTRVDFNLLHLFVDE